MIAYALVGAAIGYGATAGDLWVALTGLILGGIAGGLLACGRTAGDRS